MFQKIWDQHVVHAEEGKQTILYIDLQLVHEVTSPQAFEGLRLAGRKVRRPERTVATPDHNVPTTDRSLPIADPISKQQVETLRKLPRSSASGCTTSTIRSRGSSTSSARNWGTRSRA
jgi:3-isopropylmalate/(R)-2-methylmalate dehydratase large subunit